MVIVLAVAYGLTLLYLTLAGLYPGTGSIRPFGPTERSVQVTVESCHRDGPVSRQGLGYWWTCRISVQQDGGRVEAFVGRSIASPQDIGKTIALREACNGPGRSGCSYGAPVSGLWSLVYGAFRIAGRALGVLLLLTAAVYLFRAIVGVPTYFSLLDRWRRGEGN